MRSKVESDKKIQANSGNEICMRYACQPSVVGVVPSVVKLCSFLFSFIFPF